MCTKLCFVHQGESQPKSSTPLQVSNVIGPAVLAAAVLSIKHVTYLDVATGLFGYFLSQNLEDITGVSFIKYELTIAEVHDRTVLPSLQLSLVSSSSLYWYAYEVALK